MPKMCSDTCVHCQPYNEEWCVCWHLRIKGSKVQMGVQCTVEKVEEERRGASDMSDKMESEHKSDCAVYNGPAMPTGECDCGLNYVHVDAPDPQIDVGWLKWTQQLKGDMAKRDDLIRRMAKDLEIWTFYDEIDQDNPQRMIMTCDLISEANELVGVK